MNTQLRNGGCLTLFPVFPSPSPFPCPTALPTLIVLLAWSPVIVARPATSLLRTVSLSGPTVLVERRSGTTIKKRRKGRLSRAIIQTVWVSNNETWNRLRFAVEFPDFEMIPVECEGVLM